MSDYPPSVGPMPGSSETMGEPMGERLEGVTAQASEAARQAEQRTRGLGLQICRGAERARLLAAEGLSRAAQTLRGSSSEPESTARRFANSLEESATYLRHTDIGGMQRDAVGLVKRYPIQALGAAFVVGMLVGQRFSRD